MVDQVELRWQPIETAPHDGRRVIVWGPEYGAPCGAEHNGNLGWCVHGWKLKHEPTVWQPLPDPPHPNNTGEV